MCRPVQVAGSGASDVLLDPALPLRLVNVTAQAKIIAALIICFFLQLLISANLHADAPSLTEVEPGDTMELTEGVVQPWQASPVAPAGQR